VQADVRSRRNSRDPRRCTRDRRLTAVVVGFETDVCVAQSAIGLREHGFDCAVVADATFSSGEMHARSLDRLSAAGIVRNHA
jgi:nicotinamidase-related amidase